jgi:hypothetical protein
MVNVIWNTIVDSADAAAAFISNIWNLVSTQWQNNNNNWEA